MVIRKNWTCLKAPGGDDPGRIEHWKGSNKKANAPLGMKNIAAFASDYLINLLCIAEDTPQYDNRVYTDHSAVDEYGMPAMRIYHRYCERDIRARKSLYIPAL